jgi:hypothetical protein
MSDFSPVGFRFGYLVLGAGVFLVAAVVGLQFIESNFTEDQKGKRRQNELRNLVAIHRARQPALIEEVEVERARDKAYREARQAEEELRQLNERIKQARNVLAGKEREKEALEVEIANLAVSYQDYRAMARARLWAGAVGRRLGDSDLVKSLPFENMVISKVDEAGITVRHTTGVTGIPVSEIAPALRKALDLDLGGRR